jgi:hypothetical protein
MSTIYANGREISAKKDANKSTAAMPDVCLSPPSPPAGPIPIPYPNNAMGSDTDSGTRAVKIKGSEVGMKDSSNYKSSKGDEAATRSFGMGVVTHTLSDKMHHSAWSFNVKVEGANVIRHMDLTTHNHNNPPNLALGMNQAGFAEEQIRDLKCSELAEHNQKVMRGGDFKSGAPMSSITTTAATYTPPGGSSYLMQGSSNTEALSAGKSAGYAPVRPDSQKMACTGDSGGGGQYANHTEPKLVSAIFDEAKKLGIKPPTPLGTLKMNIHWPSAQSPKTSEDPCSHCDKWVCAAKKCGLEIVLCKGGAEHSPTC